MKPLRYWQMISFQFDNNLEIALRQQHLAAQYLALVGRYLVSKESDSSNINMGFNMEQKMLIGHFFNQEMQLALYLPDLELRLLQNGKETVKSIRLNGKSFEQGFAELRLSLINSSIDIFALKNEQPYNLPVNFLNENRFISTDKLAFNAATSLRHNAEIIITELAAEFKDAIPVRIWPHHFDTATYFATARNEVGVVSRTVGLGWAIPDEMINEPYFYLSFWSEEEVKYKSKLNALTAGKWMSPKWNGAVLKHSEIIKESSAQKQHQLVKQFFNEGVSVLTRLFKK